MKVTENTTEPVLSVVIVGIDGLKTLLPILTCLSEQTIADQIEIIPVLPNRRSGTEMLAGFDQHFHNIQPVTVPVIANRGRAAAHGVRVASAPVVAFTENHCFPDPDWAERLNRAHELPCAGIGPRVVNANPESNLSLAIYGSGYAVFGAITEPSEVGELPWHNSSYKRDYLLRIENSLEDLLAHEGLVQHRILEAGGTFLIDPTIVTRHINEATWTLVLGLNYFNGRRFGGTRGADWSLQRRLLYAALFPLLSINVARETFRRILACPDAPSLSVGTFAVVLAQSLSHTAGEAIGYLSGPKYTFDFVDFEEFMILERLGGREITDRRIARFVDMAVPLENHRSKDA